MSSSRLLDLARDTITDPRATAPIVLGMPLPRGFLFEALILVAVLHGVVFSVVLTGGMMPGMEVGPFLLTFGVGAMLWISAALLGVAGRLMGGTGDTEALLRATLWVQFLRLLAQVAVLVVALVLPPLASMLSMIAWVWGFYVTVCFVAAAHGFDSRLKALGVMGLLFVGTIVVLSLLVSALGLAPVEV